MTALTFGGAASDRAVCGSPASLDDQAQISVCMGVYCTTHTSGRQLFWKGEIQLQLNTTHGANNLAFYRGQATTNTIYRTNDGKLTTGGWKFVAVTYDRDATPTTRIYVADPAGTIAECTYGTSTDGAGALVSDAASNWYWCNDLFNAASFQGDVSYGHVYSGIILTTAQLARIKASWRRELGCKLATHFGSNGTGSTRDESGDGNTATITGTALATRGYPINRYRWDDEDDVVISAGGGGNEALLRRYRNNHLGAMV